MPLFPVAFGLGVFVIAVVGIVTIVKVINEQNMMYNDHHHNRKRNRYDKHDSDKHHFDSHHQHNHSEDHQHNHNSNSHHCNGENSQSERMPLTEIKLEHLFGLNAHDDDKLNLKTAPIVNESMSTSIHHSNADQGLRQRKPINKNSADTPIAGTAHYTLSHNSRAPYYDEPHPDLVDLLNAPVVNDSNLVTKYNSPSGPLSSVPLAFDSLLVNTMDIAPAVSITETETYFKPKVDAIVPTSSSLVKASLPDWIDQERVELQRKIDLLAAYETSQKELLAVENEVRSISQRRRDLEIKQTALKQALFGTTQSSDSKSESADIKDNNAIQKIQENYASTAILSPPVVAVASIQETADAYMESATKSNVLSVAEGIETTANPSKANSVFEDIISIASSNSLLISSDSQTAGRTNVYTSNHLTTTGDQLDLNQAFCTDAVLFPALANDAISNCSLAPSYVSAKNADLNPFEFQHENDDSHLPNTSLHGLVDSDSVPSILAIPTYLETSSESGQLSQSSFDHVHSSQAASSATDEAWTRCSEDGYSYHNDM
ncbi:hypothetical protein QVD99_005369 [Batrachochytrium dendrobatidis]|nr:hypothetical protein O5D80_004295 [Batrachochytrium dendrobatidis]KAK5668341.1 hypothetical protein QVD99_005369 [Batrachochytrium dendrobatidis]